MVASGVRRSCETDWSSADFSASLWRAISAACDSAASRSWASAWPIWSAAAASSRVSVRSGSPPPRSRSAQIEPSTRAGRLDPDAVRLDARARARRARLRRLVDADPFAPARRRASGAGRWTAPGGADAGPLPVSAATRSLASSAPSAIQTRSRRSRRRRRSRDGREDRIGRLARARARADPEQAACLALAGLGISVRDRCSAASWPTTMPTNSSRTRLSHSPGRGW